MTYFILMEHSASMVHPMGPVHIGYIPRPPENLIHYNWVRVA